MGMGVQVLFLEPSVEGACSLTRCPAVPSSVGAGSPISRSEKYFYSFHKGKLPLSPFRLLFASRSHQHMRVCEP